MSETRKLGFDTRLVHGGEIRPRVHGAGVLPIFQSTVFEHVEGSSYEALVYPRLSTLPNQTALGAKLASLEGAEAALVTASGMAAISAALLSVVAGGGHVLALAPLYGGTHSFIRKDLPRFGSSFDFVDIEDPASWKAKLRPTTRAIYAESMTNPLLQIVDHRAVVAFARDHGLVSLIDNTFTTPLGFRPIEIGYDLVLHSATKYLNGHSDLVAGVVAGTRARVDAARDLLNHLGGTLDAHACFLLDRGLKTLSLRVPHQARSALAIARFLSDRPEVKRVVHPGLETHPHHALAKALFSTFGAMLSFEMASTAAAAEWIHRLELPLHSASLGGPETLVTRPAASSHVGMSAEERGELGISDGLIRVSVGLETVEDLIADFGQAFAAR